MAAALQSIADLRAALADPETDGASAFALAKGISRFVNGGDGALARELVIRALERRDIFAGLPGVLDSLVRSVGLFPYADPTTLGTAERLAYEYHRADGLSLDGEDIVFHREQAEVFRSLASGENLVLSAPTSFGKSLVVDALVASGRYATIVIIVPTIALIDETRRRLSRFGDRYKVVTHGSQTRAERTIFVLTQERAVERVDLGTIDLLVIDEFYKLDPSEDDGDQRSTTLNHAFYKLSRKAAQIYLLGPNINEIPEGFGQRFDCRFKRTDFNTVVSELHRVPWKGDRSAALLKLCHGLDEPTLIYCKSKPQAQEVATILARAKLGTPNPMLDAAADWASQEYHPAWSFAHALRQGIGLHHGGIPRALAQQNVAFFNDGTLRFLVCTSTLTEGVNTAAKNVVVYEGKVATRKLNHFAFSNIRGRSGRMRRHFVGRVYIFDDAPAEEFDFVDIPAFTQGDDASLALLAQLDDGDLTPRSKSRLSPVHGQLELSFETIRANSGIDPQSQIALARKIRQNAQAWRHLLGWNGYPTYDQLKLVCGLIFDAFVGKRRDGISSGSQLTFRLNRFRMVNGDIRAFIADVLANDNQVAGEPDAAVLTALEFQRSWAMFRFPKLLMALDRIQSEVLSSLGMKPGNYGKFAADLENGLMPPELVGLDEYGLPVQIGRKLARALPLGQGLDAALVALRSLNPASVRLTAYERLVLDRVKSSI
jgi:hypothetical protein